jgi:hypothetical protein
MNIDIEKKLFLLRSAGCSCMTKTPDIAYHAVYCQYRLATELYDILKKEDDIVRNQN